MKKLQIQSLKPIYLEQSIVKKIGNGAMVAVPKKYLGKTAIVIIEAEHVQKRK